MDISTITKELEVIRKTSDNRICDSSQSSNIELKDVCSICHGRRIVYRGFDEKLYPDNKCPIELSGKVRFRMCPKCASQKSNIPKQYEDCTFEMYNIHGKYITSSQKMVQLELEEYCRKGKRGILLCGSTGTGKTHLLVACAKEVMKQGKRVKIISESECVHFIRSNPDYRTQGLLGSIRVLLLHSDIIMITRLGTVRKDWDKEIIHQVIDEIYKQQKILWCTSYYSESTQPSLEEVINENGIYSRLRWLCPNRYILEGQDYRELQL